MKRIGSHCKFAVDQQTLCLELAAGQLELAVEVRGPHLWASAAGEVDGITSMNAVCLSTLEIEAYSSVLVCFRIACCEILGEGRFCKPLALYFVCRW